MHISPDLSAAVRAAAEMTGQSQAQVVRTALAQYLSGLGLPVRPVAMRGRPRKEVVA